MLVIGFYRVVNTRGSLQDDVSKNSISNWSSYHPLSYPESPKDDGHNNSLTGFYHPVNHTGSPQDDGSNNSVSNWILSSCAVAGVICTCCNTSELKITLIFSWHSKRSCPYRQHDDSVIMQKEHTEHTDQYDGCRVCTVPITEVCVMQISFSRGLIYIYKV